MKPQEHMDYNVVYNVRVDRVEGYHHGYHWANNKKNNTKNEPTKHTKDPKVRYPLKTLG